MFDTVARFYASDIRLSFKIMATSLGVIVVAVLPLLALMVVGADDANPFGLGLIAMVGMLLGQAGLVAGFLRMLWEFFTGRR